MVLAHPGCRAAWVAMWFSNPVSPGFHPGLLVAPHPNPHGPDPTPATHPGPDLTLPTRSPRRKPGDSGLPAVPDAMRCELEPGNRSRSLPYSISTGSTSTIQATVSGVFRSAVARRTRSRRAGPSGPCTCTCQRKRSRIRAKRAGGSWAHSSISHAVSWRNRHWPSKNACPRMPCLR